MPREARVAYAPVISSGVTAWDPRVIEQTTWSGDRMPIRCMTFFTFDGPTWTTTWAKMVFTEWAMASRRVIVPLDSSA